MPLAAGHYRPNFQVDHQGVFGASEVDCCMACCVCRCLDDRIALCDPSSMEIARRTKRNGRKTCEKNAKKNKNNPDDDATVSPSLTKGSRAPHVTAESKIQGTPTLGQILPTENFRTPPQCNNDGPSTASCCHSSQRPEPSAFRRRVGPYPSRQLLFQVHNQRYQGLGADFDQENNKENKRIQG